MKQKIFLIASLVVLLINKIFAQINYFNFYRPYQITLCCPVNVYGLGIEANYFLVNSNTAKLDIPVSLYWGLVDSLEFGIKVSAGTINDNISTEKGLSDILLGVKYNFFSPEKKKFGNTKPNTNFDSLPTISSEFCLSLPVGDYKKGFGTGAVGFVFDWLLEKEIILRSERVFNTFLNLGYRINTENSDNYIFGNELFFSLGSYFHFQEKMVLSFGIKSINHSPDKFNGQKISNSNYVESYLFTGLSYDLGVYQQFFTSISFGIDEKANNLIFNIGMNY